MKFNAPFLNHGRCKTIKKFSNFFFLTILINLSNVTLAQAAADISWPSDGGTIDSGSLNSGSLTIYFNPNDAYEFSITLGTSPGTSDIYNSGVISAVHEHIITNFPTNGITVYLTFSQRTQTGAWTSTPATYYTVDNGIDDETYDTTNGSNLALLGTASQSSTAYSGAASRAIDGNTNGVWKNKSVTHTANSTNPWWEIELANTTDISSVVLHDRTDSCCTSRLQNVYVFFSNTPFDSNDTLAELKDTKQYEYIADVGTSIEFSVSETAAYVRVQLDKTGPLSLAEVEIFGVETTTPTAAINLAPQGTASQSSTRYSGAASRAIDENTDGVWKQGSVTHTANSTNPWWEVELANTADISRVALHNRTDCCASRLQNVYVFLSSTPFNSNDTIAELKTTKTWEYIADVGTSDTVSISGTARYVRVQLDKKAPLSLAEVEVFGVETSEPIDNNGSFTKADLLAAHRGTFKLPADNGYFSELYGSRALAVSPDGKYLFTMGFGSTEVTYSSGEKGFSNGAPVLTKIEIPTGSLSTTPTATLFQELDLTGRLQTNPIGDSVSPKFAFNVPSSENSPGIVVDDLIEVDGKLIASAYIGYDAEGAATHSHFVVDNLDLNSANVRGMYNIAEQYPSSLESAGYRSADGSDAGYVAGYMTEVPDQWRSTLGGYTHLGGQGGQGAISVIGRTNAGPGAFLFNASEIEQSSSSILPLTHYPDIDGLRLGYLLTSLDDATDGTPEGVSTLNEDTALFNINSSVEGVFFAPGTDSVVFLGSTGAIGENSEDAYTYYGENDSYLPADLYQSSKGNHSLGGAYEYQAWVYNVADYALVVNGEVSADNRAEPESYFRFRFGDDVYGEASGARRIGGIALHESSNTLYVIEKLIGQQAVVHVFDF